MITSIDFSVLSLMIFITGIFGILFNKKNLLIMLMSIEIILLGANVNFVGYAAVSGMPEGMIYSLLILTVAAAEAAIALAVLVLYFRNRKSVNVDTVSQLKG